MKISELLTCCVALLAVSGCETTVFNRGYVIKTADFSKIIAGKSRAADVFTMFGSPTMRSSIQGVDGEYCWYYVSKKTEKNGFLDPKTVDRKTVIISFGPDGVVRSVNESKYEKEINPIGEQTKTEGKTGGIVSEAFAGLGKYSKRFKKDSK
ncbi:MAG: outer membrane protein assembly factor BamE [Holosporales bacterium]|jgi:outer membrane protein assembly factor BamE (lipoprotein component of BamABCDE complex)|nr:outer membrane protein assembly factor BamE [Holosporales bacterium]